MTKAERFRVRIITDLSDEQCARMRMNRVKSISEALAKDSPNTRGYILPRGAGLLPVAIRSQTKEKP